MKRSLLIFLFCINTTIYAQEVVDSLSRKIVDLSNLINSIQERNYYLPDSLLPSIQEIDSIRVGFNNAADSLAVAFKQATAKLDSQISKVDRSLDSLRRHNLPHEKYSAKLDSLHGLQLKLEKAFASKVQRLKSETVGKLESVQLPAEYKDDYAH